MGAARHRKFLFLRARLLVFLMGAVFLFAGPVLLLPSEVGVKVGTGATQYIETSESYAHACWRCRTLLLVLPFWRLLSSCFLRGKSALPLLRALEWPTTSSAVVAGGHAAPTQNDEKQTQREVLPCACTYVLQKKTTRVA